MNRQVGIVLDKERWSLFYHVRPLGEHSWRKRGVRERGKDRCVVSKPTVKDLRPLTLMNTSYILIAMIRDKTDDHLDKNNMTIDTHSGFSRGRRMEDNVLILNKILHFEQL